jgi:Flp pilus assembly pilin Flp
VVVVRWREQDRSRGATLVEYALIVGLVASVAMGAVEVVKSSADSKFNEVKHDIEGGEAVAGPQTSTPPTTAPPTTSPPTTAATTTTTTTTKPTTTTTTAPKVTKGGGTFGPVDATKSGKKYWMAETVLTVQGSDGKPIAGAVMTVTIRLLVTDRWGDQNWEESEVEVTTGADGTVSVATDSLKSGSGKNSVDKVEFRLTGGELPGGVNWDGTETSASASQP